MKLTYPNGIVHYMFYCPGCKSNHVYDTRWGFNGNRDNPTFTPSYKADYGDGRICHLYVKNGNIEYLNDCFHEFKGQTIPMEEHYDKYEDVQGSGSPYK